MGLEQFTKHDQDKPRTDLLPPLALLEIAKVLGHGAKKYEDFNWTKTPSLRRYYAAALRHLLDWATGNNIDEESGQPVLAHAACDILFLLELQLRDKTADKDDRYKLDKYVKDKERHERPEFIGKIQEKVRSLPAKDRYMCFYQENLSPLSPKMSSFPCENLQTGRIIHQ